jgi:hypothetical protein
MKWTNATTSTSTNAGWYKTNGKIKKNRKTERL